jgi:hypothetical protein
VGGGGGGVLRRRAARLSEAGGCCGGRLDGRGRGGVGVWGTSDARRIRVSAAAGTVGGSFRPVVGWPEQGRPGVLGGMSRLRTVGRACSNVGGKPAFQGRCLACDPGDSDSGSRSSLDSLPVGPAPARAVRSARAPTAGGGRGNTDWEMSDQASQPSESLVTP